MTLAAENGFIKNTFFLVPGKAGKFPEQNGIKAVVRGFGSGDHILEGGTVVCFAARNAFINVNMIFQQNIAFAIGVFLNITNKDLPLHGETKRGYNRVRSASRPPQGESIERRPEEINQREEPFHWEMDTVKGKQKTKKCVLTLTERLSRNEITLPMYGATMENVVAALNGLERKYGALFSKIFRSITVDNGSEFSDCEGMETSIFGGQRTKMYYCHPYSSYERGSNENLNKMFRRLFQKGTNFDEVPDEEIIAAADWMNNYPREILGRTTAARAFNEQLAQIMA